MKDIISQICKNCNMKFETTSRRLKAGEGKFCSKSCTSTYRHKNNLMPRKVTGKLYSCDYCGKDIYKTPSQVKLSKSGLFFCCREHKDKSQVIGGSIAPKHYGNCKKMISSKSYRKKAFSTYANECNDCGWNEYVDVLVVHHIDGNRNNNELENLVILCPTHHYVRHYLEDSIGKGTA